MAGADLSHIRFSLLDLIHAPRVMRAQPFSSLFCYEGAAILIFILCCSSFLGKC